MIPEFSPGVPPEITPAVLDLSQYPDALVTTYTQIGLLVLAVGLACLIGGFFIGRKMAVQAY